MSTILYIFSFLFGLTLGSFYNVVGIRVPKKESLLHPPSHCPRCGVRLSPSDLVPVVSYLLLKGKCRSCDANISIIYPVVELGTACLFTGSVISFGLSGELLVSWSLISLLVIIFISDIRYMLIPDRVLAVFAGVFLIERLAIAPFSHWWQPFVGAGIGFIVPFLVAVVSRGNMGGGDIKLFAVLGLVFGWEGVLLAFFFSTFYGAFIGGIGLLIGKIRKGMPVPFGPFIVMGALTAHFYGDVLLKWYFHL